LIFCIYTVRKGVQGEIGRDTSAAKSSTRHLAGGISN
jgi:hypothetical protein